MSERVEDTRLRLLEKHRAVPEQPLGRLHARLCESNCGQVCAEVQKNQRMRGYRGAQDPGGWRLLHFYQQDGSTLYAIPERPRMRTPGVVELIDDRLLLTMRSQTKPNRWSRMSRLSLTKRSQHNELLTLKPLRTADYCTQLNLLLREAPGGRPSDVGGPRPNATTP